MKLISCTEFVRNYFKTGDLVPQMQKLNNYAEFLQQPLTLGMFIPTNEKGEVLEEPKNYRAWLKKALNTPYDLDLSKYEEYKEAEQRLIFEGCDYDSVSECVYFGSVVIWATWKPLTIESLIPYNLTITENAINQFKLR